MQYHRHPPSSPLHRAMPDFARLFASLLGNPKNVAKEIKASREGIQNYLREDKTTREVADESTRELDEVEERYRKLTAPGHDPTDPEVVEVITALCKTIERVNKRFKKKSSEAMKGRVNKSYGGDFTQSSASSSGAFHRFQHRKSHPNQPQPASQRVAEPIWTKEQFAAYNAQKENPHLAQYDSQQDDNSSGRATTGHTNFARLTSNSVDTFGNPIQDSQINPTASSTGHDGQSTESFSSSRPPSSNYTYYSRQNEGSSSRQGSSGSRRSIESRNRPSFQSGGSQDNFGYGSPQQPSFAVHYSSQPSRIQIPPSPHYNQAGPLGYPEYHHSSQYLQGQTQFVPSDQDDDEDHRDPGYSVPQAGPSPGQGRGYRGGYH